MQTYTDDAVISIQGKLADIGRVEDEVTSDGRPCVYRKIKIEDSANNQVS